MYLTEETDEFRAQVISVGTAVDYTDNMLFLIRSVVIRVNYVALNAWFRAQKNRIGSDFDTFDEYFDYLEGKKVAEEKWRKAILAVVPELVSDEGAHWTISRNLSEIFTAVSIAKIGGQKNETV